MKYIKLYEEFDWDDFEDEEYEKDIDEIVINFLNPPNKIYNDKHRNVGKNIGKNVIKINTDRWSEFVSTIKKFDKKIKWMGNVSINDNDISKFEKQYEYDDLNIIYIFIVFEPYCIFFRDKYEDIPEDMNVLEIL